MSSPTSVADLAASAVPFALPMTRTFRGTTLREGVLIPGPSGWGEWAPFPEYDDATAARWLLGALEAAYGSWPEPRRPEVEVNAVVPALPPDDAAELARQAYRQSGCATVKVKVAEPGGSLVQDEARVAAVADAVPDARLRLDANGAWDLDTAFVAVRRLARYGLEYVEQPCPSLVGCAELRERLAATGIGVLVAVDEGVRQASDLRDPSTVDAIRAAADVVVVKSAPLGGVRRALDVVAALDRPAVVSGALDSAVGLSAGVALAAALPEQPYAAGLGTGRLLAADVVGEPLVPRGGRLPVGRVAPEPAALEAGSQRVTEARAAWWRDRLVRCAAIVEEAGERW